jgi:arylsulfatase A-like enzyme
MPRPNVLLFFTDDQRFDTIHALGNPAIRTPHLDRLVARGTAFTHAHIPGGTSGAVCMPSRAMLHTGRSLFHIEAEGQDIPTDHTTMGECFQQAGYETFGTGKWHNGPPAYARSFTCGGEIMFGGMEDHWNVPACNFDPSGLYDCESPVTRDPFYTNNVMNRLCDHITPGRHSTDLFTDATAGFLRDRDQGRPFFAYVSLMAPHDPRTMPDEFLRMYDPADIPLPGNFLPQHPFFYGVEEIRDEVLADYPRTPDEIRRHIAEYYAMITHLDHRLGTLLDQLEKSGEAANTIIVFAGDNGLAVGQHGLMGKQNLYDHSVRVPLVLAGPGIPVGETRNARAYLFDIFPTLCDLMGVQTPASVEGETLVACLDDPANAVRESLYLAYENKIRGVRMGDLKLVEYANDGMRATQLFDLATDPHEMHNLSTDSDRVAMLCDLRAELLSLRDEWDDRLHPLGESFWDGVEWETW